MSEPDEIIKGGNVADIWRVGQTVRRKAAPWTNNVNSLLKHVRSKGFDCVPEPLGIDEQGRQILSFIEGRVPHELPQWLWSDSVLESAARMLRGWHDASQDFNSPDNIWGLEKRVPEEVICHNDFAPYNCIFREQQLIAFIDFDTCAPGPRLWDIAYALYRFVPLIPPPGDPAGSGEASPFNWSIMHNRVRRFLDAYLENDILQDFSTALCLKTTAERIRSLADWSEQHSATTGNPQFLKHALMYKSHADWLDLRSTENTNVL